MKLRNKFIIWIISLTLMFSMGLSGCGIFKKGCNCPKVKTASQLSKSQTKSV